MPLKSINEYTYYEQEQLNKLKYFYDNQLRNLIDTEILNLKIEGFVTKEPVLFKDRLNYELKSYQVGDAWGELFDCGWFKLSGKIKNYNPNETYYLKLDLGGEALLYNDKGVPLKGFTSGPTAFKDLKFNPSKIYYPINDLINDSKIELWVDAGANDLFGRLDNDGIIKSAKIVKRDLKIRKLMYDVENLLGIIPLIKKDSKRHQDLYNALIEIYYLYIYDDINWLEKSLDIVKSLDKVTSVDKLHLYVTGHAHIDLAWLWPIRETKRKLLRTITNVFYLIENHDRFIFGISQPQMILWLKEESPELYEKFKQYVKIGRIELQGGMWVEADTNIPNEESLVRQMLYGIKFYEEEFNVRVKNLWLPDTFGFNANMPQIIKKSGLDYFLTIKLTWNLYNEFPHNTFRWRGIDKTDIIAHIPPLGNYNSNATPLDHFKIKENYKEIKDIPIALNLYGIGDGGGGPGLEHLERIDRQKNFDPLPYISHRKAERFFEYLENYKRKMPFYDGELYLENHQGVYTSKSEVKRYNNLLESTLKTIETYLVINNKYHKYHDELNEIWKEVLLYQFHDILPGTSIKRVYDELIPNYQNLQQRLMKIVESDLTKETMFNPLLKKATFLKKENNKYYLYDLKPLSFDKFKNEFKYIKETKELNFNTNNLKITLDNERGVIKSIIYKNKETLNSPNFNQLLVYKDIGDAWNIEKNYRIQTPTEMKLTGRVIKEYEKIIEINQNYTFKNSHLKETIIINQNKDEIEFHHEINWQDLGYMLRSSFPINIDSNIATYDIQFGNITRSRTKKDSYDLARFEVPMQNWVSLKNNKFSFSLITSGKYGTYTDLNLLDLNLLRSTNRPGINGDIGKTSYKYLTVFHEHDHMIDNIDHRAMVFNTTFLKLKENSNLKLFELDNIDISYSTIKESYDKKGIIIRLYERSGYNQEANLKLNFDYKKLELVNLVEDYQNVLANLRLKFKPFEIKTIKIYL
ncbi:MAG: glycoside hydrolase family 38 C-terminal domain-containing protein [Acholeplasmataceae bacterium]